MSSALKDVSSRSVTSSVTSFSVEVGNVVVVSGSGYSTLTISKIFTDKLSTVVVIPEVVRGQRSP